MLHQIELKQYPEVLAIIRAAFPSYKKRLAFVSTFSPTHGKSINSYWDGGSRSEYAIVHLATRARKSLPTSTHPFFDVARQGLAGAENEAIAVDARGNVKLKVLPDGYALIEAGICRGKAATAHLFLNPENFAKLLPSAT